MKKNKSKLINQCTKPKSRSDQSHPSMRSENRGGASHRVEQPMEDIFAGSFWLPAECRQHVTGRDHQHEKPANPVRKQSNLALSIQ